MSWKTALDQSSSSHRAESVNSAGQWPSDTVAKPIHIQRVEEALTLEPLLAYIETFRKPSAETDVEDVELMRTVVKCSKDNDGNKIYNGVVVSRAERKSDKSRLYNFSRIRKTRKWLKNVLLSDTSSDEDGTDRDCLTNMCHEHLFNKRCFKQYQRDKELKQYQYYSVGLLSNYDKFYDHQKSVSGPKKKLFQEKKLEKKRLKEKLKKAKGSTSAEDLNTISAIKEEDLSEGETSKLLQLQQTPSTGNNKVPKSKVKKLSGEQIAARRRKIWVFIAKKEVPRAHRQKTALRKETLAGIKKVAKECQKECRKSAILSQKSMKEATTRSRRLSKEMQAYWKRFEKVEKEHRKKAEKEALEQRKMDIELREMKRQQRKLNFLITQTELYAHFMARKLTGGTDAERDVILSSFEEEKSNNARHDVDGGVLMDVEEDDYDPDEMKAIALSNAEEAYKCHQNKKSGFDKEFRNKKRNVCESDLVFSDPSTTSNTEWPQPAMFEGMLKVYQLKGMNWLANLYDQGINGILADEMGLGKTVQSIAFLAHLAESQSIWGPFLVIAPASTLHNWQQEVTRFLPQFKVVPYWGNTQDRKILRRFWNKKHIHMKESSFHIVITSYQLIVQDAKYFQQIEWHYMILDEAQAIKSSASSRWKSLLVFKCRNRLLLTGTPIQNSMAELWALLHFIMPTLFDSHDEFNEWFSKDIENHVEKQSNLDKNQLGRLHMILKPFMLRRVKKDVENELSDKIEILLYCPLTMRQKMLYQAIKNKISIDDLFKSSSLSVTSSSSQAAAAAAAGPSTSSLMNLVMQFRKVCNHPELFERRDIKSPFYFKFPEFYINKFLYREGKRLQVENSCDDFKQNFSIFNPQHIHESLFPKDDSDGANRESCFSFTRFVDLSPAELHSFMCRGLLVRWLLLLKWLRRSFLLYHRHQFHHHPNDWRYLCNKCLLMEQDLEISTHRLSDSRVLRDLVFTRRCNTTIYVHADHIIRRVPDRNKRSDNLFRERKRLHLDYEILRKTEETDRGLDGEEDEDSDSADRSDIIRRCMPTDMPSFLYHNIPKVTAGGVSCYTSDRSAEFERTREAIVVNSPTYSCVVYGVSRTLDDGQDIRNYQKKLFFPTEPEGLHDITLRYGFSNLFIPEKETLVIDAGKLAVLDKLLSKLKSGDHRVLIYSQMTRMIDILEEYLWYRKHTYIRLDGSSKIADRRDMVADFQTRSDIFVFLLSTRAGGLGINLTAADTVIFYDSDWNPTVDQQAMDRAHRLGQTKQVTVYRLICKGTIEERILQRAKEKSEIQRMVISGGNFAPDILKPKEVVSLLLDDDEMGRKLQQRQDERKLREEINKEKDQERKRKINSRKPKSGRGPGRPSKKTKLEDIVQPDGQAFTENITIPAAAGDESSQISVNSLLSAPPSPHSECLSVMSEMTQVSESIADDESCDGVLVVDDLNDTQSSSSTIISPQNSTNSKRGPGRPRGRPRGAGVSHRSRGRGSIQKSLSAAEAAAAVAAKKAAYAAYGYSFTDCSNVASQLNKSGSASASNVNLKSNDDDDNSPPDDESQD